MCRRRYWWRCKVNCLAEVYEQKQHDVIVQSPHDFATLATQLMPATTVLHASQTDIDYTTGSVEPWDDVQAIAEFVGKAGACSRI